MPHCICVYCIYLETNSDIFPIQHMLTGIYNPDEKCLLRGTDWVFKYSSLRFVFQANIPRISNTQEYHFVRNLLKR
jgi:hypothetical protein